MLTSLVSRTRGVNTTYTYQYDANGLQLYKVEPKGRTDFEYNDLGRIKKVTEPGNRITQYTYDNAGNCDTQTVDAPGLDVDVDYIYNIQNWLVQTAETRNGATTTAALTYDDNGNQETVTETGPSGTRVSTYEYDNFNQLKTAQTPDGEVITSKYDASGMRIEKTVNGVTTTYHYDGANVILEETGGTHNRNIYGINLIARNDGTGALYYLYNGHGDVVKLVNASRSLVNEYDYDIFGNPLLVNESRTNPFRYAGYFYDDETGYYYLNSRYYDPKNARFITEDTYLGKYTDPLSLNLYTYCYNDPINLFDPTGHIASAKIRTILFMIKHPIAACKIGEAVTGKGCINISTVATRFSTNDLGLDNSNSEGSQVNAFRHVLWQIMITNDFGENIAIEAGNAHEENPFAIDNIQDLSTKVFSTLSETDESIDLLNNIIGREIGINTYNSRNDMVIATLDYYHEKGFWVAKKQPDGTYMIVQEKLSNEQYKSAKKRIQLLDADGFTVQQRRKIVIDSLRRSGI